MALLFEIYQQGRRLTDFNVRGACVMGAESVPVEGRISFVEGLLRVETPIEAAVEPGEEAQNAYGVALLWDAGEVGSYILETTRLPHRTEPYVLNVELARHRLMRLLHKQEDWNLWDDQGLGPAAGEALRKVRDAQMRFAEALGKLHEPASAATISDDALAMALEASEELALCQAEASLGRRRSSSSGLSRVMLGVRADPSVHNAKYRGTLARFFDYSIVPVSWRQLQPEEDRFETESADLTIEFLARNRVPIIAGPLVDLSEGQVPEWLFIYENDFESLRDLAFDYVRSVVTRYRRIVRVWSVVCGLHASNGFGLSFEQMIELTRLLVGQVKSVNAQAKTLVTVRMPHGEYLCQPGGNGPGVSPQLYAEMVAQSGVECDGFGIEIEMGVPRRGYFCRDLFQISAMLDRFAGLGKPVFITSVACPDRNQSPDGLNPIDAGRWRGEWSSERQAKWLRAVYRVALSKGFVENVAWADLSDIEATHTRMPGSGLLDDMLRPKPAFEAVQEMRRAFRPPQPAPGQAPMPTGTLGQATGAAAGALPPAMPAQPPAPPAEGIPGE